MIAEIHPWSTMNIRKSTLIFMATKGVHGFMWLSFDTCGFQKYPWPFKTWMIANPHEHLMHVHGFTWASMNTSEFPGGRVGNQKPAIAFALSAPKANETLN